jgi:hypothetical protein
MADNAFQFHILYISIAKPFLFNVLQANSDDNLQLINNFHFQLIRRI